MASYGIQFDDVPGYVDSSWEGQDQMGGGASPATSSDAVSILRCAAVIIIVALIALWAMGYWFKKG